MADAKTFLADIEAVCRAHGLCISHEDTGGSFIIAPINEPDLQWLRGATVASPSEAKVVDPALDAAGADLSRFIDD